jgi:hypothetical protein
MEYSENEDNEDTFGQEQIGLFNAMHISGTPADICPNLTSFVFGYGIIPVPWDLFFAMAQSHFQPRPNCPCHLTWLRIFNARDLDIAPPDDLLTQISGLRNQGLNVSLLDHHATLQLKRSFGTGHLFSFCSS